MKDRYKILNQRRLDWEDCSVAYVTISTNLGKFIGRCRAKPLDFDFNSYPSYHIAEQRAYLKFLKRAEKEELNKTLVALQMYKISTKTKSTFNSFYNYYLQYLRATNRYEQVKRDLEQYIMSLDKHH